MHLRIFAVVIATTLLLVPAYTQQSHWASADDKTAKYIIEMERKWAEGACVDNGVVAGLLADDFQGTSTKGGRFKKADELKDQKGPHIAHDCQLDEAKVLFFGDSLSVVYGSEHYVGKDKSEPNAKVCQVWTDTWLKAGVRGRSSPRKIIARNVGRWRTPELLFCIGVVGCGFLSEPEPARPIRTACSRRFTAYSYITVG